MTKKINMKKIGLFVIIGFCVFIGIILHYGFDKFILTKQDTVVMYFRESVKGLNVGAPVVLEGVQVGKVTQIDLITDVETMAFQIPVYVQFNHMDKVTGASKLSFFERGRLLHDLIQKGLRAKLVSQSYLTGQLMIELEMAPDSEVIYQSTNKNITEIPTRLSTIRELSKEFSNLPLKQMTEKLDSVLTTLDKNLPVILPQIAGVSTQMNEMGKNINDIAPLTTETLTHMNKTLESIGASAKSLRNLTDYLERHPESILKGKK